MTKVAPQQPPVKPPKAVSRIKEIILLDAATHAPADEEETRGKGIAPIGLYPAAMQQIIREVSHVYDLAPEGWGIPVMCAESIPTAALANMLFIDGKHKTRANTFMLCGARTGTGKSEVFKAIAAPLFALEDAAQENHKKEVAPRFKAQARAANAELKKLEGAWKNANDNDFEKAKIKAAMAEEEKLLDEALDAEYPPSFIFENATSESMGRVLSRQVLKSGIALSADARIALSIIAGCYKKDGGADDDLVLKGYSGDPISVFREGKLLYKIDGLCLSVCWLIQPDKLKGLYRDPRFKDSGLLGRFNVALCEFDSPMETDEDKRINMEVANDWARLVYARYLCGKLRARQPKLRIIVGLWGATEGVADATQRLRSSGADEVVTSLFEAQAQLAKFASLLAHEAVMLAPSANDEEDRLAELDRLHLMGSANDPELDRITAKLARILNVPIALISFIDKDKQFFKSQNGLPVDLAKARGTSRDLSVCSQVVASNEPLIVSDLARDRRFANNPLLREGNLRFYAGVPLRTRDGLAIGSLCVLGHQAREFSDHEKRLLEVTAEEVMEIVNRQAGQPASVAVASA